MHHLSKRHFPFSAIVGQEILKRALVLNAVNPLIGGVLIKGTKGTAKSTAARALAEVLPEIEVVEGCPFNCHPTEIRQMCDACAARFESGEDLPVKRRPVPFVTLPLSATEDRVVGTIDVTSALKSGTAVLKPGLLAEAHRGILYVDEVNLLDDHLVNVLLDAAAMGRNIVEREGISVVHPARFILIGTMNPEEGELRPQLLDRFGIMVEVEPLLDVERRVEIVYLIDLFERDPHVLVDRFEAQQHQLATRIQEAISRLPGLRADKAVLEGAARRALEAEVDGHRADVAMVRVASTLAAFDDSEEVTEKHLDEAAPLVLNHRLRRRPFEPSPPARSTPAPAPNEGGQKSEEGTGRAYDPPERPDLSVTLPEATRTADRRGKGAAGDDQSGRGKKLGSRPAGNDDGQVDVAATLLAAAAREGPKRRVPAPEVTSADLRSARVSARSSRLICFVVDASGSMGSRQRLEAVREASRQLLEQSYQGRNMLALVVASGDSARTAASLTKDAEAVERAITEVAPAGRTPLASALQQAACQLQRGKDRGLAPTLVLLTDGRANLPLEPGGDPVADTLAQARHLSDLGLDALVVDTENDFVNLGLGREIAELLGAHYLRCESPEGEEIAAWITR